MIICGNTNHPRGIWHIATPLPATWQWLAKWRYMWNMKKYGCGCSKKG